MLNFRIRTFLVVSLFLHILVLSILAAFFLNQDIVKKSRLIVVGYLKNPTGSVLWIDNPSKSFSLESSKQKNKPSKTLKAKKVIKKTTKQMITHKKKEIAFKVNENLIKQNLTMRHDREVNKQENDIKTTKINSIENPRLEREIGSKSSGQHIVLAHPDYKVNPKPRYPRVARRKGFEGAMLLKVWVLDSGHVGKIELQKSSGYEILDKSALEAVKDWIFIPGKRNGEPVSSWVTVPIKFQLTNG